MTPNTSQRKRTPARPAVDQLFEDAPQGARDALAMHKDAQRRKQRLDFAKAAGIKPEVTT